MKIQFPDEVKAVNIGLPGFARDMKEAGVQTVHLDWKPPAGGDEELLILLEKLAKVKDKIETANAKAMDRVLHSDPVLVDLGLAGQVIPEFPERTLLHAGPPVTWKEMCGPVRGALIGAILFEGWADTHDAAAELAAGGKIGFAPCHHFGAVGPMTGVLSPSMPVFVVENKPYGNRAYASLNEGLGKVLRFGANSPEVLERLIWLRDEFYPVLRDAVRAVDGIIIKNITSQALQS